MGFGVHCRVLKNFFRPEEFTVYTLRKGVCPPEPSASYHEACARTQSRSIPWVVRTTQKGVTVVAKQRYVGILTIIATIALFS